MEPWYQNVVFYHIYPLGLCAAPAWNDFQSQPVNRLESLLPWIDHIAALGCTAVYLGPLFESGTHGYDTADYYWVDRRLGDNAALARLVEAMHARGLRVVLDGVFNHVGRNFWAFRDVRQNGPASAYCSWFSGLRFDRSNGQGDPFCYDTWNGYESLVRLNLGNPAVRQHLLGAVDTWMRDFGIDGLRLDAADCVDLSFQAELAAFCRSRRPDFWLMGEIIHGDYNHWANPAALNSVTNYECYKGLYSSLNDSNYFEIAYALERQSGAQGLYRGLDLYTFVDNHDVTRAASILRDPAHLFPLYALLFTMPGIPSLYYGSEFGQGGVKEGYDTALRPALDLNQLRANPPQPGLWEALGRLIELRRRLPALQQGSYRQLAVTQQQLAFLRQAGDERVVVALNAGKQPARLSLRLENAREGWHEDLLNPGQGAQVSGGTLAVEIPPGLARVILG